MNNRFSWLSIRKLIVLFIGIFILAALVYMGMLYRYIDHSKVADKEEVIQFVNEASDMQEVTEVDYFADQEVYDIVLGNCGKDKPCIVFNPSGNRDQDKLTLIQLDKMVSKEKIEKNWRSACEGCTLKKSSPAILEGEALWELTYLDQDERYVMEYIALDDGSTYEKLQLNKKY